MIINPSSCFYNTIALIVLIKRMAGVAVGRVKDVWEWVYGCVGVWAIF